MGYTRKDRIVKGLKCCRARYNSGSDKACDACPYHDRQYPCMDELLGKAIDYIGEKGRKYLPECGYDSEHDEDAYYCGECGRRVFPNYKCCPGCGEEIDWCEVDEE